MFIRKDNTLKWKWILFGAILTLFLVLFGVFMGDRWFHLLVHKPDCNLWTISNGFWCSFAIILGKIFSVKNWVFASAISVIAFFIYF